jgi:hypothetical protein
MSDRAILVFGMEQTLGVAPSHCFWLYLIDQQRFFNQAFPGPFAAVEWARKSGMIILDAWTHNDLVAVEDVIAENSETGAFVVCITLYRNGSAAPNDVQPSHRYWIFRSDGARIATRATLGEAFGWIGVPLTVNSSHNKEKPSSGSTWEV